jgi:hypothetical protein
LKPVEKNPTSSLQKRILAVASPKNPSTSKSKAQTKIVAEESKKTLVDILSFYAQEENSDSPLSRLLKI